MSGLVAEFAVSRPDGFNVEIGLDMPMSTTIALLGPNGAGKSTAVAAISGLLPIDAGRIVLGGVVLDDPAAGRFVPAEQRAIGVVFQDYLLFPYLSVVENVAFGLRSRGMSRREAETVAASWLHRLDLEGLEGRRPGALSGGQAQRVALARALVIEPDLLLLDEPLAALDVTTRADLRRSLGTHLEEFEGPRLLITHDPMEAFLLADEVYVMENGTITQTGTPDDIRLRPRTPYAADLAGSNLARGVAGSGVVDIDGHAIHIAESDIEGAVLVTIHPHAVAVHGERPVGSPRNSWRTTVELIEPLGERVRFRCGPPLPLTVELTKEATNELALVPGAEVWVAVKATEIGVEPA
jgi:molybdate transport system ATP-binding protein